MGVGQHVERQFGLGADGVETGRVEDDQPLLQQRMGKIDQRMAPARNRDAAVAFQAACGFLVGGIDQAEGLGGGGVDVDRIGQPHQRRAHFFRGIEVERKFGPGVRVALEVGNAALAGLGVDGQQPQRRSAERVEKQFGGAHGGAPGGRRQHALPVIRKEDGVDEFGLAARKLGDEGHVQLVFLQAAEQLVQAHLGFGVAQFLHVEPVAQRFDTHVHGIAPGAVVLEFVNQGSGFHGGRSGIRHSHLTTC